MVYHGMYVPGPQGFYFVAFLETFNVFSGEDSIQ